MTIITPNFVYPQHQAGLLSSQYRRALEKSISLGLSTSPTNSVAVDINDLDVQQRTRILRRDFLASIQTIHNVKAVIQGCWTRNGKDRLALVFTGNLESISDAIGSIAAAAL